MMIELPNIASLAVIILKEHSYIYRAQICIILIYDLLFWVREQHFSFSYYSYFFIEILQRIIEPHQRNGRFFGKRASMEISKYLKYYLYILSLLAWFQIRCKIQQENIHFMKPAERLFTTSKKHVISILRKDSNGR